MNISRVKGTRALLNLVALLLLVSTLLTLSSCSLFTASVEDPITEEEYLTLAETLRDNVSADCNEKYYYVSSYLDYWDFPAFEISKLKRIERYYSSQYYQDLGYSDTASVLERARLAAEIYIDLIDRKSVV